MFMKAKFSLMLLLLIVCSASCYAQNDSISEHGFYIPKNISESNLELDKILHKRAKEKLILIKENELDRVYGILVLGEWFDDTSRFTTYFKNFGITDWIEKEDLTLLAYHRKLNQKPFDLQSEVNKLLAKKDSIRLAHEIEYKKNIIADSIEGVFIPTDLISSFKQLDKILNDSLKHEIKSKQSSFEMAEYHMGLGRWLRNNWGLWSGSRLQLYFKNYQINHPDNMSGIILTGYQKYLNGIDFNTDSLFKEMYTLTELPPPPVPVTIIRKNKKKYYSRDYKKFLRTRKIKDFDII